MPAVDLETAAMIRREAAERVIRRAPAWWQRMARQAQAEAAAASGSLASPGPKTTAGRVPTRATAGPQATKAAARPVAGWIAGICCPGVSVPSFSKRDGMTLPEQFTDACLTGFAKQWSRGGDIPLLFGHGGPVITRGALNVVLRFKPLVGLEFVARLFDSDLTRRVFDALGDRGLAVSIGYHSKDARQWHTDRPSVGKLRVVDGATLDHIAIIPATSGREPAYRGAIAYGMKGNRVGCPSAIRDRAQSYAYQVVKRQAFALLDAMGS